MLDQYRTKVLITLRNATIAFGSVALALDLVNAWQQQRLHALIPLIIIFFVALFFLYVPGPGRKVRSWGLALIPYFIAIDALISGYLVGSGRLWLIAFCTISGALLGKRIAIAAIAVSAATYTVFVSAFQFGMLNVTPDSQAGFEEYMVMLFVLVIISIITSLPASFLLSHLEAAYLVEKKQRDALERMHRETFELNQSLMTLNDTVANSIKPPLRRIDFLIDVLKRNASEKKQKISKGFLNQLETDIARLYGHLKDAQTLSQLGPMAIHKQQFNLSNVARREFEPFDEDPSLNVTLRMPSDLQAFADKQLSQLFFRNVFRSIAHFLKGAEEVEIQVSSCIRKSRDFFCIAFPSSNPYSDVVQDGFLSLYSPFMQRESGITGAEPIIAQRIIALHDGELDVTADEQDKVQIYFTFEPA